MKINYAFNPQPAKMERNWAFWKNMFTYDQLMELRTLGEQLEVTKATTFGAVEGAALERTRSSYVSWISYSDKSHWLYTTISDCFREINATYFGFDLSGFSDNLQYTIYDSSRGPEHYDWHIDSGGKGTFCRKLSMTLQLSDPQEYEGGELWLHGVTKDVMAKEQGYAVFFPSYTLHRVTPVTSGIRRSLVAWASGPEWR